MARSTSVNFSTPSFSKATVDADPFDANDVQQLAEAVDLHTHATGKGLAVALADSAVTNAKLASDTARANLLTNGGFEIWQRGSGPFTTPSYCADRWFINGLSGGTISVQRDTSNAEPGSTYCVAIAFTRGTADSRITQDLKFSDFQSLKGMTVTLSVRVKTTTAGAFSLTLADGVSSAASPAHSGNGLYQTLSVTFPVAAAATFLQIWLNLSASATVYVDNAMLVVGSQAADYAPLHPADDLARSQRYCEIVGGATFTRQWVTTGISQSDTLPVRFAVSKAVAPTLTKVGTWTVNLCGQPSAGGITTESCFLTASSTGAGNPYYQAADANAYWMVEANP